MQQVYGMAGSNIQFVPWQKDPFNLFNDWASARMQETPVRPRDGKLSVSNDDKQYVVLPIRILQPALASDTQHAVLPLLDAAKASALVTSNADILMAGVILHAAKATTQAKKEISIIGTGSLIGIVLLIWLTFRTLRPILLVAISLASGVLTALTACSLCYGQIHVLTLVFGASVIGLAQDYGIYYLCNRAHADANTDSWTLIRKLLPGMGLTLLTTVTAYFGLMLTPFPGLQQMALFAITGLIAAWLTVVCWFPVLAGQNAFKKELGLIWYQKLVSHWPTVGKNIKTLIAAAALFVLAGFSLMRLCADDDIRMLQNPDPVLLAQQAKISELMDMPSMTQFFLIKGENDEEVLQREEKLQAKLAELADRKTIRGWQAISSWIPSIAQQQSDRALINESLYAPGGAFSALQGATGIEKSTDETAEGYLTVDAFLNTPAGEGLKHLWLGKIGDVSASIVTVKGVSADNLQQLKALEEPGQGITWIDKVEDISSTFGNYRVYISIFIVAAYGLIWLILSFRYRSRSWRIVAPPFFASLITLTVLGLIGQPLNLFNILAFMLILGVGVDSGIFFSEQPPENLSVVWLETGLAASSTILSFGLLCFSKTQALHAFGLTMFIGISLVWFLVPCFRNTAQGALPHNRLQNHNDGNTDDSEKNPNV